MKTSVSVLCISFLTVIMFSCHSEQKKTEQTSDFIEITTQQFTGNSMELGTMERLPFDNIVNCNGTIVPMPNGYAKVNALVSGIVKSIACYNGQRVTKDQVLVEVGGTEIIDLQKEYAEASASFSHLRSEFERTQSLYNDKVTSEKEYVLAQSEYKSAMARYNSLKLKVEAIGFQKEKIENGDFYTSYYIKSPVEGYVSVINTSIGNHVDSQNEILEIVNPDMMQIKLAVFPGDISKIKTGQPVRCKSSDTSPEWLAKINSVGIVIDPQTKSIFCYAALPEDMTIPVIANDFVESGIITSTDTVFVIPKEALIKADESYFVLQLKKKDKEKLWFSKQEVKTGREKDGYIEILNQPVTGQILTKGTYNINLTE